ncbi:MAG: PIN domain-containing protein [unclassified Hahellaceae]|nr:PIN domain-containing protein [Hahellaceae bacterium]|tara:strand:- start:5439 stop:6011 length:573 start_codon:yes stop_codon:yes gene_type:complete
MSSNYTVVYDANVLYPAPLRSFLMYLALSGEFRARWSNLIHEEWIRNLLVQRPDLKREKLERVRDLMNQHVPGSVVAGFESLVDSIHLPDPNDRHVVAAAIQTRAEAIVTFNLKDFPDSALEQYCLTAIHPDEFISSLFELNAGAVIEAARRHRLSLKHPSFSSADYLDLLQRQKLPKTFGILQPYTLMI